MWSVYHRLDYGMTIGIERSPNGRLWACWVGGGDNEKAFFVLASSDDRGATWSKVRAVIDPHDEALPFARRVIVGALWLDPRGRLWWFFDQALSYFDGRAGTWAVRCDQPDAAEPVWSEPVRIWHGCVLNKPMIRANGEWLLTISLWDRGKITASFADCFTELDECRMINVFVSQDEGRTWGRRGGVRLPNPEFDEAHIIERRDGSLWLTGRTHHGLWQSSSMDGGASWQTPSPSPIANVNSRHFLQRLRSGRLLLVKHGLKIGERPSEEPYHKGGRSMLSAFLSDDDGATWSDGLLLDERCSVSYPDGTQMPDGTIYVSYDHDRDGCGDILFARFREEDVDAGRCVSAGSMLRQPISRADPAAVAKRHARERRP